MAKRNASESPSHYSRPVNRPRTGDRSPFAAPPSPAGSWFSFGAGAGAMFAVPSPGRRNPLLPLDENLPMDMGGAYSNRSFGSYGGEDVSVASAMSAASAADWEPTKELVEKLLVKAKELDPATVGRSIEKQAITTFFDTGEIPDVQQMVEEITADPLKSILVCMGKNNIGMNKTALVQCQANSRQAANAQASYVEKHMKQELTDRLVRDHALAEYERAKRELESMEAKYSETVAFLSDAQKLERKYRQREALANIFTALIDELKNEAFRPFGTGPIEDIQR